MKSINYLQTDNPQVALIVAAHNAASMDQPLTLDPNKPSTLLYYREASDQYAQRFAAAYRVLARAVTDGSQNEQSQPAAPASSVDAQ